MKVWPQTEQELIERIRSLMDGKKNYNTSAEAARDVALAAFHYAAHVQGLTGFQAGWCSLEIIRDIRGLKGPFGIVDAEHLVYPQCDELKRVAKWLKDWEPWAADQARERLADPMSQNAHPNVLAHWKALAAKHPRKDAGAVSFACRAALEKEEKG